MPDIFDYDVFLSFSSKDEEVVKPVWQELSHSGLRVFWSDETLKQNVGQSFFEMIQESLINSRHFLLLMSANAAESEWVKLEYATFFNKCFLRAKGERRLIVHPIDGYDIARLPPFLKNLQIARSVKAIIPLLGGVDIQALRKENAELRERVEAANRELRDLNDELRKLRDEAFGLRQLNADIDQKLSEANQEIRDLKAAAAKGSPQEKVKQPRSPKLRTPGGSKIAGQGLKKTRVVKDLAKAVDAPPAATEAPPPRRRGPRRERYIGRVTNYYVKVGVAVVSLQRRTPGGGQNPYQRAHDGLRTAGEVDAGERQSRAIRNPRRRCKLQDGRPMP